jgi:hypothetical protein
MTAKYIINIPINEREVAMLSKSEPVSARFENRSVLILSVIFIALLLMAICAVSVMVLNQLKGTRPTPQQAIPAAALPIVMPATHFLISLPVILSESASLSEQIWKVTKIKLLGYELDDQHYDLATFTRIDGQETVQGYCINRGWDIPDIGTEYLLNAQGIFVPLYKSDTHPLQRFSKIQ